MTLRGRTLRSYLPIWLGLAFTAALCAQPRITGALGGSLGGNTPVIDAITSGSPIQSFLLHIPGSGSFTPANFQNVTWFDPITGITTTFTTTFSRTSTEIVIIIPSSLFTFSTPLTAPDLVSVQVNECNGPCNSPAPSPGPASNVAQFTINPPLTALLIQAFGYLNAFYSQNIFSGGTAAFTVTQNSGSTIPPGLTLQPDGPTLSGTPTTLGRFFLDAQIRDVWGNIANAFGSIQILNPPTISSVLPNSAAACSPDLQITVNGANFTPLVLNSDGFQTTPNSVVMWTAPNSTPVALSTTFVSANQLTAIVPAALLQIPGVATISVAQFLGSSTQFTSNGVPFTVRPPTILSLNPPSTASGGPAFTLTVLGTDFQNGAQVTFNGVLLPTTFVNSGTLTAQVPANLILAPGQVPVTVVNPCGATSAPAFFTIIVGPIITSLVPNFAVAGGPAFTLKVNGPNLASGMTILWNGSPLTGTTLSAPNQLSATVPANLIATPGTASVSVSTPQGAVSGSLPFTIVAKLSITTTQLPNGIVGTAYSATLTGTGGLQAYNWAATGLPPGLQLNATTGAIAGTPTTAGPFTVSVTLTDNSGQTASAQIPLTINPKLSITSTALPNGIVGTAYSATLAGTGGVLPYAWAATGLPPGLQLNATTGAITGTPTTAGPFTVSVTLTDNSAQTASAQIPLTIIPKLSITTTALPNGIVGTAYSATLAGTGGVLAWVATGLPPGLSLNATTGAITGTPTTAGPFTVSVTLTDNAGQTATAQIPLAVAPKLLITTTSLPPGAVGVAYSAILTGTGGVPPYGWTATGLPQGLTLNPSTGAITGMPTAVGSSMVSVTLKDTSGQTAAAQFQLTIANKLVITTTSLPPASGGFFYFFQLTATGGIPPYTWSATGLPFGLSLNPATGAITGNPVGPANTTVSVTVTDTSGQIATAQFTLTVSPNPVTIATGSLPAGIVGVAYVAALGASNGTPPYVFSLAGGSLPDGITLSADGFLTGTPTTAGTSRFTVKVTDSTGGTATKDFSLEIKPAPLALTGTVSDGVVGATISVKFGATGGAPGYLFSASGSLPPGTSFKNDGTLSGTLTAAGSFTFSVTVTDTVGATATRSFTINVTVPPLTIATASLPSGQVGVGYSAQLTATGGTPPYTWSAGGLPGDLSVSSSGVVSGTPASDGTFTVSVTVTDSAKKTATRNFSLVIIPAPLVISTAALPNGTVGVTYQASTAATGGVPPYTWTFTGLPGGVSGAADGTLSGTPLAMGTFSVGATVTDSKGVTASKTFSVTIAPPPLVITTASIPNATVGTAVSLKLAATGGVPPLTWSATGLPANLSVAADGTLSGTPAAPGTTTFTATVKDSAGTSTSKSFQLTVVLPPSPGVNLTGLPPSSNPNTQPRVGVSLPSVYPVDVTVTLTLTFVADSGPDDQKVMFQTGGRSATIVIPAGSTVGANDVGVQVGTVAGTITITTRLTAAGQDITPTPPPTQTLRIIPSAPVIVPPVTATRNSTGFTVAVTGFSSTRELTQAVFQFTAAAGGNLQTSQVTIPVGTLFAGWFQSAASAAFGSQFTLTQPFTVTGSTQIVSVTVTLVNSVGSSGPMSANLQ